MKMELKTVLPGVKKNISLKNYTTFAIGGRAGYFFKACKKEDLVKAIGAAAKLKLPFFILGKGSNLLISDRGFKGLVIKIENSKLKIEKKKKSFRISAEAGASLADLVSQVSKVGGEGFEWASGIPGSVGGAIFGNAGAFGGSMASNLQEVEVFNVKTQKIERLKKRNCHFGYRESIFKKNKNLIILEATFLAKKGNKKEIKNKIKKHLFIRREKQPLNFPSIGSIFKNPEKGTLSAGQLIEMARLKGKKIGGAQISEKHGNFIINRGRARASDVKKLIEIIKKKVGKKFGVNLKEEIRYLGF